MPTTGCAGCEASFQLPRAPIFLDTGSPPKCSRSRGIRVAYGAFCTAYAVDERFDLQKRRKTTIRIRIGRFPNRASVSPVGGVNRVGSTVSWSDLSKVEVESKANEVSGWRPSATKELERSFRLIDGLTQSRDNRGVVPRLSGPVAQLGARFHGMEEVIGSIPIRSTNSHPVIRLSSSQSLSAAWDHCMQTCMAQF